MAGRAGVSKPILYDHFPSKRDLYLALIDADLDDGRPPGQRGARRPTGNRERIRASFQAYFDFVDEHGPGFRLLMQEMVGVGPRTAPPGETRPDAHPGRGGRPDRPRVAGAPRSRARRDGGAGARRHGGDGRPAETRAGPRARAARRWTRWCASRGRASRDSPSRSGSRSERRSESGRSGTHAPLGAERLLDRGPLLGKRVRARVRPRPGGAARPGPGPGPPARAAPRARPARRPPRRHRRRRRRSGPRPLGQPAHQRATDGRAAQEHHGVHGHHPPAHRRRGRDLHHRVPGRHEDHAGEAEQGEDAQRDRRRRARTRPPPSRAPARRRPKPGRGSWHGAGSP